MQGLLSAGFKLSRQHCHPATSTSAGGSWGVLEAACRNRAGSVQRWAGLDVRRGSPLAGKASGQAHVLVPVIRANMDSWPTDLALSPQQTRTLYQLAVDVLRSSKVRRLFYTYIPYKYVLSIMTSSVQSASSRPTTHPPTTHTPKLGNSQAGACRILVARRVLPTTLPL